MRPRTLVSITLLALCHLQVGGQAFTNAVPSTSLVPPTNFGSAQPVAASPARAVRPNIAQPPAPVDQLPDDPGQEMIPVAQPQPVPSAGEPIHWTADEQTRVGDISTLNGKVTIYFESYTLHADKVIYHQSTSEVEADGHLLMTGGPNDVYITATQGDLRLNTHTARFFNVDGSQGVRRNGKSLVYSTTNPMLFHGRVLLQLGEGNYRIIDGSITNCRLPHPDWRVISKSIELEDQHAAMKNAWFEFLGMPLFYLPYLRHPANEGDRESGLLIPVPSNSSIKGFVIGEQIYWAINRSMDMIVGTEYYSKRGWAPNGDFRYKGSGYDHLTARWNALLDRGVEQEFGTVATPQSFPPGHIPGPTGQELVNQGGVDVVALGRKDLTPNTRVAGTVEYLSSYVYRLMFAENYSAAVSSEVSSDLVVTHQRNGFVPSVAFDRFQTFASTTNGDEARILHLPEVRYDVVDRPLGNSPLEWGFSSSAGYLNRSEPRYIVHNVGRLDIYPHFALPFTAGGWSIVPEAGLRTTYYTKSQTPDLTGAHEEIPFISHDPVFRADAEASLDIRPPALERDFKLPMWNRELRHVIEPEITYRFVGGIGNQAQHVLLFDTTDIVTNTNQAGFSLTQRFYLRPLQPKTCSEDGDTPCPEPMREWASWQIEQEYYIDPNFGEAVIPGRRNVFESTLDLTGTTFVTSPRNLSPIISRMRFEAINNLRVQWDMDYDPRKGQLNSDSIFAGYSWGSTTVGVGHALLNALEENPGTANPTLKSQIVSPFLEIGKQSRRGFNMAANGGYDFVDNRIQYGGVQAVYNWDCCGLTMGYRRFQLGSVGSTSRNEQEWLYGFTLANFGTAGDVRRTNSVFHDPTLPPVY
jgi:LPS-assembly protein